MSATAPHAVGEAYGAGTGSAEEPVVVIGAGPAGLTAALHLAQAGRGVIVLEADDTVGGLSRTVQRDGWRFDIGGHRFFTRVPEVEALWHDLLGPEDFWVRSRMSRIRYRGTFFDYPIRPLQALRRLGVVEALRCALSYLWVHLRPPRDRSTLEGYIVAAYGRRLYRHFFEAYNLKVWGVPASELSADWGAQRIKGMSLRDALWEPVRTRLRGGRGTARVTSLIERFHYPRLGPGMMWERCRDRVVSAGGVVTTGARVTEVERDEHGARAVWADVAGIPTRFVCSAVISSMPLAELAESFDPPAPSGVREAAGRLGFRDFLTVALVIDGEGFPDNWIYVHEPAVQVGRVQNYGRWSPQMVEDGRTCLGLEYFVHRGDGLWSSSDEELVRLATAELEQLGLVAPGGVRQGYVVRVPKAYPVYRPGYEEQVRAVRGFLEQEVANLWPVGRNGMHRYNNQDHSMLTATRAVDNVLGRADHDVWAVNVDGGYHEEKDGGGTGRSAPVVGSAGA